jgi:hypothetical protein
MLTVPDRNATAVATLRIFVGIFFLAFGEYKVLGTEFTLHGGLKRSIRGSLRRVPTPGWRPCYSTRCCHTRNSVHS